MVAAVDLRGQRFGRLLVVERDGSTPRGMAKFSVVCDCGSRLVVEGRSLRSGNTSSCGCLRRESVAASKTIDLTGKVFGRLTVLEQASSSSQGARWRCLCECGTEVVSLGKTMTYGNTASCGCANAEWRHRLMTGEFIGSRYGSLVVLSMAGTNEKKRGLWLCRCDCGSEKTLLATSVKCGRVISCGCALLSRPGLLPEKHRAISAANCAKRRARKLSAGGTFTAAQITELYAKQRGCCANCGVKLGDEYHRDHKVALSKGGTNDILNIELLCGPCNLAKNAKDPVAWAQENGRLL